MILVVDDEPRTRFLLAAILKQQGYEVAQASDGLQALRVFSRSPPDVVIADLRMPELDGTDLAIQIHANWPKTGVILTSGYFTDKAQRIMSAGLADFIYKPIDQALLLVKIKRLPFRLPALKAQSASHVRTAVTFVEFRKTSAVQTWHSSPDCNHWPKDEFQSARDLPLGAQLCNECLAKEKLGARK
jgi:DNA-binding NtrC family response regulator